MSGPKILSPIERQGYFYRWGKCLTIVMGEFDGKKAAFLLQNMFPVRHSIHRAVSTNMKQLRQLHARGRKVVFPDISRLEKLMLEELEEK